MNEREYDQWSKSHADHFPSINAWITRLRNREGIEQVWRDTLSRVSLENALTATTELYSRPVQPRDFGRHAAIIAAIARDLGAGGRKRAPEARFVDGEQVFECLQCQDNGLVICWHPKSMEAVRDGTFGEPFTVCRTTMACDCEAGKRHQYAAQFDASKHCLYDHRATQNEARQQLREFVAALDAREAEPQEWKP